MNTAREEVMDSVGDDIKDVIDRLEAQEDETDGLQAKEQVAEERPQEQDTQTEEITTDTAEATETADAETSDNVLRTETEPQKSKYSAPVGWSDEAKTQFAELPEPLQEAIHSREHQIASTMESVSRERKLAQTFLKVVEPFRGLMAAEGLNDPLRAVQGLMTTTAQLAMGSPEAKARKIAELVGHYGIDIEMLDKALNNQLPENPEQTKMQSYVDQRLGGIENYIRNLEASRKQSSAQSIQQDIESFAADPKHEFFDKVRFTMADLLDLAAQRGQAMTMDEAYNRACAADPEISQLIASRAISGSAPNVGEKRRAASSMTPSPAAAPEPQTLEGLSVREILEKSIPGGSDRV